MISGSLLDKLMCPVCKKSDFNVVVQENGIRCSSCGSFFSVKDGVPCMLEDNATAKSLKSKIHLDQGSDFNYVDHYQKDAHEFDYFQERFGATFHSERRVREFLSRNIKMDVSDILDVGSGSAWVAKQFCPEGKAVVSMDISPVNIERAMKEYPFENHAGVVGDAFAPPFKKQVFDCVIASEVIEHVARPDLFVRGLFPLVKPGGQLIITTPYKEKLQFSLCIHCNKPTPQNAHIHSFDENILCDLYRDEDLEKVSFKTFNNKVLMHLRAHVLLKHFGFRWWYVFDKLANFVYNAPVSIMVNWSKKE